jgi:RNA polymerase sigma factor (sigma-70 family)
MPLNRDEKPTREACHAKATGSVMPFTNAGRAGSFVLALYTAAQERAVARELSEKSIGGDDASRAQALSQLFEQHNRTLVSFLVNRLGNEAEAKEVAQEAYVRVLQLHEPGAVSFLRAYLFRVAANIALDRIRRRARSERFEEVYEGDDLTTQMSPDRHVFASSSLEMVKRALLELPERYRRAFLLHRFEDKNTAQIGRELGIQERQARNYIRRTVTYCRLRLDGATEQEAREQLFL